MPETLLPLDEQISMISEVLADHEYKAKRVKSPIQKRRDQRTIQFFKSILGSLKELETIKNLK